MAWVGLLLGAGFRVNGSFPSIVTWGTNFLLTWQVAILGTEIWVPSVLHSDVGTDVPFMNSIIDGNLFLRLGNLLNLSHRCHYWWIQKWKQVLLLLYIVFFLTCLTNTKGMLFQSLFNGNSTLFLFLVSPLFLPPFTSCEYIFQVLIPSLCIF